MAGWLIDKFRAVRNFSWKICIFFFSLVTVNLQIRQRRGRGQGNKSTMRRTRRFRSEWSTNKQRPLFLDGQGGEVSVQRQWRGGRAQARNATSNLAISIFCTRNWSWRLEIGTESWWIHFPFHLVHCISQRLKSSCSKAVEVEEGRGKMGTHNGGRVAGRLQAMRHAF